MAESWRPWRSYAVIALWRAFESSATSGPDPTLLAAPPKKRIVAGEAAAKESA
jgi:hypothetical protein